ncbi:MAG: alpha/beta hydrolase [bacterium]
MKTPATFMLISVLSLTTSFAMTREPLWKEGAPGAKGSEPKDIPTLDFYPAENGNGVAVVICPGGGYGGLASGHEGKQIAAWLNENKVMGIVLEYRHSGRGYRNPAPMQDVQRAIQTVRARAAEFGIASNKIGVLGFSAGGHLAGTAATKFTAGDSNATDPIAKLSSRPDFAILCYAVLSFGQKGVTHFGSQHNLLGADASEELIKSFSIPEQVTRDTPPTFLWHTDEDTGVPPENSINYYNACRKYKVPAELHIFAKGHHGVGLGLSIEGTKNWSTNCISWLKAMKFIP